NAGTLINPGRTEMVAVARPVSLPSAGAAVLPLLRPARRDALPEHIQYADTGCEVRPSSLSCRLVRCRFDEPGGVRRLLSQDRDRALLAMQRRGRPINAIAQHFG